MAICIQYTKERQLTRNLLYAALLYWYKYWSIGVLYWSHIPKNQEIYCQLVCRRAYSSICNMMDYLQLRYMFMRLEAIYSWFGVNQKEVNEARFAVRCERFSILSPQ